MVGLCSLALWCTGHFLFIPPYSVNGWCIIFGPMVYRAFLFFLIPPYGVNGRFMFFGPVVYRAGYF